MSQKLKKRGNDDKDDDDDDVENNEHKNITIYAPSNSTNFSPATGAQAAETYSKALEKVVPWDIDYLKFRP